MDTPKSVEATLRESDKGRFLYLLNHSKEPQTVTLTMAGMDVLTNQKHEAGEVLTMAAKEVMILSI